MLFWTRIKEVNKNKSTELQLWPFLLPVDLYAVFYMGHMIPLVPFQIVYPWISESLVTLVCLILWPFSGLHSAVPTPQPTESLTEATSLTASISLFPAPCRCLRSSSTHLWWRLNSSLSSSIFLLIDSQVCWFESVFKPSFSSSIKFLFSILTPFPAKSIANYKQEFFRLLPKSIDFTNLWVWVWTLHHHFEWVAG